MSARLRRRPILYAIPLVAALSVLLEVVLVPWALVTIVCLTLGIALVPVRSTLGHLPTVREMLSAAMLAGPVMTLSLGTFYLVYWPLSFGFPDLVERLLREDAAGLSAITIEPSPLSVLRAFLVIVTAASLEELVFRGVLLRWLARWLGTRAGVALSSCAFGLLHPEPLGATVFGLIMAALYLRTRSLLVPILTHTTNNLLALVAALSIDDAPFTLAEFQATWWIGLVCLLVVAPWTYRFATAHWRLLQARAVRTPG